MLIKDIELNNFRIYKGQNTVNILPENDKNIIIISGKNGFGKTTFLMSLVWCLYGRQMERVDALYQKEIFDQGGYGKYIGNSLNRLARSEGETNFSASITFSDVKIPDITCSEIKITRTFDIHTGEKVEILIDGHVNGLIEDLSTQNGQNGEEIFIRDFILPIEIAKFFLFDAEKIVSLAEINSNDQRKLLSQAYTEVLGIKKYEDLKDQLETIQDDYRKKSASKKDKTELNQLIADIENTALQIEELEKNIEALSEEKVENNSDSNEIQRKLVQEGNQITLEQLRALKEEEGELAITLTGLLADLKDLYDLIPFGLAGTTMMEVALQLNFEKLSRDNKFNQESVNGKTAAILDDLEKEKKKLPSIVPTEIRNFYDNQISRLIKKHFFDDDIELPTSFSVLHDFSDPETNEFQALINDLKIGLRQKFETLHQNHDEAKSKFDSIRRKIRNAEKDAEDEYISALRQRKDGLDKRIVTIENDIGDLKEDIGGLKADSKSSKQRQEELRKKIDASRKYGAKDKKTQEIIQQLKTFIKDFKIQKKKSLEKKILAELTILMHKKGFIKKVSVDISQSGDDVDINLFSERGEKIEKGSLSMGERQMYASSLLKALVDESDIAFPVFIDSPMQKFDEDHALNIIKEFYPNVSEQVVIFPLIHKEITVDEFNLLKAKISRTYLINNIDVDASEFISVEPNNLFAKYDELQNAN